MIELLVSRVFSDRNAAHIAHWASKGIGSYAQHIALGELYEALPDLLDKIVEAYQGAFDLIGPVPAGPSSTNDILADLEDSAAWIELNRDKISKRNSAIANLVDGLLEAYYTAIYKLRNLR